ncbi:MAG: flavodoxin [Clostridiales bacterium]|nr:flavodoxin [Clostridiales bacterium]
MGKIAVVYKSKYGSTKKYAQWIAEECQADLFDVSEAGAEKLKGYDTIVYGGAIYASGISGVSVITKNYERLKDKKIIVFTVGIAAVNDEESFLSIIEKNFSKEMISHIKFFHFRGGIDYKNLGMLHKSMLTVLKAASAKAGAKKISDEEIEILVTKKGKLDYTDRKAIEPLLQYLKA